LKARSATARRDRARVFLRAGVTLTLLAVLFSFVDWSQLATRLAGANPVLLAGVIGLATGDRLLMAWKWWLLIRGRAAAVSLWAAVRAYYLASFVGYLLPMTVGADAVRVASLSGGGRTAGLVASVLLERMIGVLAQAVLAGISLVTLVALGLGASVGPAQRWLLAGALLVALLVFPFTFPVARRSATLVAGGSAWRGSLGSLLRAYGEYGTASGLLIVFFALTLLEGAFPVAFNYVAGRALGLDPGWTFYIATVPLVYLVARLPVSLGGLGFLELSFVSLAAAQGIDWTDAFAIASVVTALYLLALTPGALLYFAPRGTLVPRGAGERMP
jgi:glycosyltransferase 2 family protein